jgi:hypothetical protein
MLAIWSWLRWNKLGFPPRLMMLSRWHYATHYVLYLIWFCCYSVHLESRVSVYSEVTEALFLKTASTAYKPRQNSGYSTTPELNLWGASSASETLTFCQTGQILLTVLLNGLSNFIFNTALVTHLLQSQKKLHLNDSLSQNHVVIWFNRRNSPVLPMAGQEFRSFIFQTTHVSAPPTHTRTHPHFHYLLLTLVTIVS